MQITQLATKTVPRAEKAVRSASQQSAGGFPEESFQPTLENLMSPDLKARLLSSKEQIQVRMLDTGTARQKQACLALQIAGAALTGLEGASLTLMLAGDGRGRAEVTTLDGLSRELSVQRPGYAVVGSHEGFEAGLGYVIALPDGSSLTVSDNLTSMSRQSQDGQARLTADFRQAEGEGSYTLTSLSASKTEKSGFSNKQLDYSAEWNSSDGLLLSARDRLRNESLTRQVGTSGVEVRDGNGARSESDEVTSFVLLTAARKVEAHPFLGPQ
jgi:hypothetical protein